MPSEPRALFHGVRPLDAVEGQSAERLGRTLDYCEFLFDQREKLALPRHPEQWRDALLGFLADLAQRDDENSRSEEHTSELQSRHNLVCRLLLEKKNTNPPPPPHHIVTAPY